MDIEVNFLPYLPLPPMLWSKAISACRVSGVMAARVFASPARPWRAAASFVAGICPSGVLSGSEVHAGVHAAGGTIWNS
jgi:hypothetical protein